MSDILVPHHTGKRVRVIACSVFKPVLKHFQLGRIQPGVRVTYLPSQLHNTPQKLEKRVLKEIISARRRNEAIVCLYGQCFLDIDSFCERHGVIRVSGINCAEMLLGRKQFERLIDEAPGTYFLEQDLILNFEKYCLKPLDLEDEEMRKVFFERYQRLVYVRQPSDPDLLARVSDLAQFLELPVETREADYSCLQAWLVDSIARAHGTTPGQVSTESLPLR